MAIPNNDARTAKQIIAESPWIDNEEQGGPMREILWHLDLESPTKDQLKFVYEELVKILSDRHNTNPSETGIYLEEQNLFVQHLATTGFSESNLAHLLHQANAGCLEGSFHHIIKDWLRTYTRNP
jgi:hypothetical protein